MTASHKIIFETGRLLLRQQVLEDLDDLWAFHCNPENIRYYADAPETYDEVREELEWHLDWYRRNDELGTWAIIYRQTGTFIGLCSLMPWTVDGVEEVEMSYSLAQEYWGQGLGSELSQAVVRYAFEKLRLSRLISLIEPDNMVSRHVVEISGMRFEKEGRDETGSYLIYTIINTGREESSASAIRAPSTKSGNRPARLNRLGSSSAKVRKASS